MKLLLPKVFVTKRENVRGGKCVQVFNEKKKHAISIPEASEVKMELLGEGYDGHWRNCAVLWAG